MPSRKPFLDVCSQVVRPPLTLWRCAPTRPGARRSGPGARATAGGAPKVAIPSHGYDYYELLGVEPSAPAADIKRAYRWLQKRCHPDVAGDLGGHEMAVLLNEAYGVLVDGGQRATYDKLRAAWIEDEAYTGQPVYSKWLGAAEEPSAAFVDELSCIGCLKCATVAPRTFAVEKAHGRARAVWQWGDDEATIGDAMSVCPVDCIQWVERDKLPALEFVTSRLPRRGVGMMRESGGGGHRTVDVFEAADDFLRKRSERLQRRRAAAEPEGRGSEQRVAAEAIHMRAGRWWRPFFAGVRSKDSAWGSKRGGPAARADGLGALIPLAWAAAGRAAGAGGSERVPDELRKIHAAAAAAKRAEAASASRAAGRRYEAAGGDGEEDEYWTPGEQISCAVPFTPPPPPPPRRGRTPGQPSNPADPVAGEAALGPVEMPLPLVGLWGTRRPPGAEQSQASRWLHSTLGAVPALVAAAAAAAVGLKAGSVEPAQSATGGFDTSPVPFEVADSLALKALLAALVWYAVGAVLTGSLSLLIAYLNGRRSAEEGSESVSGYNRD